MAFASNAVNFFVGVVFGERVPVFGFFEFLQLFDIERLQECPEAKVNLSLLQRLLGRVDWLLRFSFVAFIPVLLGTIFKKFCC